MSQAKNLAKLAQNITVQGILSSSAVQGGGGSGGGSGGPKISSIVVTNSSYTNLDDTAVDIAGGYIKLIGSGFASGCQVLINNTAATSTTFVSDTEVRAQVPATTAGTYIVYLVNSDGGVAIRVNGVTFSATPTWTTASSIDGEVNTTVSIPLIASGATTYSLASGSTLPSGLSLSSGGLLSGSTSALTTGTTYSFTINATDAELQDSPRTFAFSITVSRDPHFRNTSLLLSANGTNDAQNNTFLDSSTNNFAITRSGNTTQGSFSPYEPNWSNSFASNTVLQYPATSSLANWWTQDFTIEMWVCNNTTTATAADIPLQLAHGVYNSDSTYWAFGTTSEGRVRFYYYNGGSVSITTPLAPYKVEPGKWCHIAMVYTNSTGNITLFLNGMPLVSATKSGTPQSSPSTNNINIGAAQSTYYNGAISNLRILNGTALYTSAFTPSTTSLTAVTNTQLLTCQSNCFRDNSTNNATPTLIGSPSVQSFSPFAPISAYSVGTIGGSAYFDGTGDYLTISGNSNITIGTGPFTLEAWCYFNNVDTSGAGFGNTANASDTSTERGAALFLTGSGAYRFRIGRSVAGQFEDLLGSTTLKTGQWYHFKLVRASNAANDTKVYLNGIQDSTGTSSIDINSTKFGIGLYSPSDAVNTVLMNGYISDVRLTNTVVSPTVPTVPLTAVSGTKLLCNFTNAGVIDAAMINNLETVGNAKISTTQAKFGSSSMYFDGVGDYLQIRSNPTLNFGTGDFTIECWSYLISRVSNYPAIFCNYNAYTTNSLSLFAGHSSGSTTQYQIAFNGSGFPNLQAGTVQYNTWTHLAVVRESGLIRLYINGVSPNSAIQTNYAPINVVGPYFYIGTAGDDPAGGCINGYIDDFRVTKGIARYTQDFTPPATAHLIQ